MNGLGFAYRPITPLSAGLAKSDTQELQKPEIPGVEYQHGELLGYTIKQHRLERGIGACIVRPQTRL
jgi:hypothetical protein